MNSDEYQWAVDFRLMKAEKPDQAAGRALGMGEIMALVASCADGSAQGHRDAAILAVAYACGLRRSEIVNLDLEHFSAGAGVLTVAGKGNKTRTVPIQNGARGALGDWLAVRGSEAGPLFWHVKKGGAPVNRRLTAQAVYVIFAEHAAAAGVAPFSPHDLRRTFAGDLLDAGADISTVQKMMGHSSVATTAGYDRRGERAKQDAAKKLHFPYQSGKAG
jgi:site-specific recombinase XerD